MTKLDALVSYKAIFTIQSTSQFQIVDDYITIVHYLVNDEEEEEGRTLIIEEAEDLIKYHLKEKYKQIYTTMVKLEIHDVDISVSDEEN